MAELVIARALLRVAEHFIRLVYFLKLGLTVLIAAVQIGMVLLGQSAIRFFYLIICRGLCHAQHFIVISLIQCLEPPYRVGLFEYVDLPREPGPWWILYYAGIIPIVSLTEY